MKFKLAATVAILVLAGALAPASAWACKGIHKHGANTGAAAAATARHGNHAQANGNAVGKAGQMNGTVAAVHRNANGKGGTMAVKVAHDNKKNNAPPARTGKGKPHTGNKAHHAASQIVLLQVLPDTQFERDVGGTLVAADFSAVLPGQHVAMTGVGFQIKTVNILSPETPSQTAAAQKFPPANTLALR